LISDDVVGINVTIPYKQSVMAFMDELSPAAEKIGAVNTILQKHGKLIGYNTDYMGFKESLEMMLGNNTPSRALVLGTGGSSRAVRYALKEMNIDYSSVSRHKDHLTYEDLTGEIMDMHTLIINTTPLGMYPNINDFPKIPYSKISNKYFCYDLVYNPEKTVFLVKSERAGAAIKNGYDMLLLQAEKSWQIWNQ
jgi:shikimate dehydrogenase